MDEDIEEVGRVKIAIHNVGTLLASELYIPDYQRPYKWKDTHVNQLLDDITHHMHSNKQHYRIGTVVLHKRKPEEESTGSMPRLDIVDGQQRLITLTLLIHALNSKSHVATTTPTLKLLERTFSSPITHANVRANAQLITRKLPLFSPPLKNFKKYVLENCELVCIVLDDLSEAFQFFDAQNARGKPLALYDLLKAFHLREIPTNEIQQTQHYVQEWEDSVSPAPNHEPSLETIVHDILYPLRRWMRNENGMIFDQTSITLFKGISPEHLATNPMTQVLHMLDAIIPFQPKNHQYLPCDACMTGFPFQIEQHLINGKRFFEYIQYYRSLYRQLFIFPAPSLEPIISSLSQYSGHHRTGDKAVKNLFYSTVLFYYDKFGQNDLKKAVVVILRWSYFLRFEYARITSSTVNSYALASDSLLRTIQHANSSKNIINFTPLPLHKNQSGLNTAKGLNQNETLKSYFLIGEEND